MTFRRSFSAVLVVVLLLLAADYAAWRWAVGRLEDGFTQWQMAEQAAGWRVISGTPQRGGWPFLARLKLPQTEISGGAALLPGGVDWQMGALTLQLSPWQFSGHWRVVAAASGAQTLHVAMLPPLQLHAEALFATLPLAPQGDAGDGTDLVARQMRVTAGDAAPGQALRVATLALHMQQAAMPAAPDAALALAISASGLELPVAEDWLLGPRIAVLEMDATLRGPIGATSLAAWRDGGGRVEIQRGLVRWASLRLGVSATLGLDAALRPQGSALVQISGQSQALDMLVSHHAIDAQKAMLARAALALLHGPAAPAGSPADTVTLPLNLQDNMLRLGQIPLLRLPPGAWQAP